MGADYEQHMDTVMGVCTLSFPYLDCPFEGPCLHPWCYWLLARVRGVLGSIVSDTDLDLCYWLEWQRGAG